MFIPKISQKPSPNVCARCSAPIAVIRSPEHGEEVWTDIHYQLACPLYTAHLPSGEVFEPAHHPSRMEVEVENYHYGIHGDWEAPDCEVCVASILGAA